MNKQVMKENWRPYYEEKKNTILDKITPLLHSVRIKDFEYIQEFKTDDGEETPKETLRISMTYIGCTGTSIARVFDETLNYVWVMLYARNNHIGAFQNQTLKYLKQYWRDKL